MENATPFNVAQNHPLMPRNAGNLLTLTVANNAADEYTTGYDILDGRRIQVAVHRLSNGIPATIRGRMLEVSSNGMKLATHSMVPVGETVNLQLQISHLNIDFSMAAAIGWVGYRGDEDWLLGCSLAASLPQRVVSRLARDRYIERRSSKREAIFIDARVAINDEDCSQEVTLLDYSSGGFRMSSKRALRKDDRVLLELRREDGTQLFIPARACWCTPDQGAFLVGCKFLVNNGFESFQSVAKSRLINRVVDRLLAVAKSLLRRVND